MSTITIYHNPACGTSRNVLALIRNSGEEPTVIEYLKTPPDRETLQRLITDMGVPVRAVLREKGTPYAELGLDDPKWSDAQLIDCMLQHPILINRPIVVTPLGTRLCRPSEAVLDILPDPQRGAFSKEDGEAVIDADGRLRVAAALGVNGDVATRVKELVAAGVDVLVVDEASMLDLPTLWRILKVLGDANLLLVGDPAQLPPIGFGLTFHVFCQTERIPNVVLDRVLRQSDTSGIPSVAEAVRLTGALQVDVSSGVESSAGVKDAALIRAFLRAAG